MNQNHDGFSLIEIMIVIFILGIVTLMVVPGMRNYSRNAVRAAATETSVLINEASIASQASGKIYRVTFDIDQSEYWAEYTSEPVLMDSEEARELREQNKRLFSEEPEESGPTFILDKTVNRKKRSLPTGVTFKQITTEQSEEPFTEGEVYIHMFPHGLTERAIVQFTDNGENIMSVLVLGLLGKTSIEGRAAELKDLDAPKK